MQTRPSEELHETARMPTESMQIQPPPRPHPPHTIALLIYHRDGVAFVPLLEGSPVIIGRHPPPEGGVAIDDRSLSRAHARFLLHDGVVTMTDLESRNGTWTLGQRVESAELAPGDEVQLGAVPIVVHGELAHSVSRPLSHERFRLAVEDEGVRSRHFGRPFCLMMVRALAPRSAHVSSFHRDVSVKLRAVDRVAFYSSDTLEILLPEASVDDALALGRELTRRQERPLLGVGIAVSTAAGGDAEVMFEACRSALLSADSSEPVRSVVTGTDVDPGRTGSALAKAGRPIVANAAMKKVFDEVKRLANASIPILIVGETGTGKEVLARRIHEESPRRGNSFVVVNCAAIPEGLVESTLFGHTKGSFTGALRDQTGLFEAADGGTLMLDEIGDLPKGPQAALLRALETGRILRVGSTREIEVNIRIIAATHRDLEAMVEDKSFRDDLFHRLGGIAARIPPLRERVDEIRPLCEAFIAQANEANGRSVRGIEPRAMELIAAYRWPGNVRELRNGIERAVVLCQSDMIRVEDLPERVRGSAAPDKAAALRAGENGRASAEEAPIPEQGTLRDQVAQFERQRIVKTLNACGGNQRAAAERLGLPIRTLVYKMKTLDIRRLPYSPDPATGPGKVARNKKGSKD